MNHYRYTLPLWQWPSELRSERLCTPQSPDLLEALLELDQLLETLQERLEAPEGH